MNPKTVGKYISQLVENEKKGNKSIKEIEIEARTNMIGMKEEEHKSEKYFKFRNEIFEDMTKLLQLRWNFDA